jgi:hypothetical protein
MTEKGMTEEEEKEYCRKVNEELYPAYCDYIDVGDDADGGHDTVAISNELRELAEVMVNCSGFLKGGYVVKVLLDIVRRISNFY